MFSKLKGNLVKNLANLPGWTTNKKIIVIESDDWGSIRMPSLKTYDILTEKGLDLSSGDDYRYNKNDTLEDKEDFEGLFETLSKFKDKNNNSPVFTAVSLVANPDFDKIKKNNFQQYFWEPFTETLNKYNKNSFSMWKQGIDNKLFIPQFHGREHLNVAFWMRALKTGDQEALLAFDHGLWGFNNKHPHNVTYQAAFDLEFISDLDIQKEAITSGIQLFEELFHYKPIFFVPPNGPFNNQLEKSAFEGGIKYMSTSKIQNEVLGEGKTQKQIHYLGQKNKLGQTYITRNCFFEPSQTSKNWIDACLNDIEVAFRWKKPAVISSHRVNYIGGLNQKNREKGLHELNSLLEKILQKWPDVQFMTSNDLGNLIVNE